MNQGAPSTLAERATALTLAFLSCALFALSMGSVIVASVHWNAPCESDLVRYAAILWNVSFLPSILLDVYRFFPNLSLFALQIYFASLSVLMLGVAGMLT